MNQTDHDLLITVHEQVRGVRDDIKDIKDGIKSSIDDHEVRLRSLEKRQWLWAGAATIAGMGFSVITEYFIQHK